MILKILNFIFSLFNKKIVDLYGKDCRECCKGIYECSCNFDEHSKDYYNEPVELFEVGFVKGDKLIGAGISFEVLEVGGRLCRLKITDINTTYISSKILDHLSVGDEVYFEKNTYCAEDFNRYLLVYKNYIDNSKERYIDNSEDRYTDPENFTLAFDFNFTQSSAKGLQFIIPWFYEHKDYDEIAKLSDDPKTLDEKEINVFNLQPGMTIKDEFGDVKNPGYIKFVVNSVSSDSQGESYWLEVVEYDHRYPYETYQKINHHKSYEFKDKGDYHSKCSKFITSDLDNGYMCEILFDLENQDFLDLEISANITVYKI
jgi:hypothetical protein